MLKQAMLWPLGRSGHGSSRNIVLTQILCLAIIVILIDPQEANAATAELAEPQQAILVTGASSGIGRKIAEVLAENGYFVYAGARKQQDLDALNAIENVQAIRIDVTKQSEIDAAVAPLIIESKGRITMIGSIAGSIGIGFLGPYSMSKHAIEAYTDSLAAEMQRFGVEVSVIEPGNYSSKIWNSYIEQAETEGLVPAGSPYAEDIATWIESVAALEIQEPDAVADAALHALFSSNPKRRYLVVPNAGEAEWTIGSVVRRLAELNAEHDFSYSQEELIEMLKGATAAQALAAD